MAAGNPPAVMIVEPGDTVVAIAARYRVSARDLITANAPDPLTDITPGQTLRLPQGAKLTKPDAGQEPASVPDAQTTSRRGRALTPTNNLVNVSVGSWHFGIGTGRSHGHDMIDGIIRSPGVASPFPLPGQDPVFLDSAALARLKANAASAAGAGWYAALRARIPASPAEVTRDGDAAGKTALDAAVAYRVDGRSQDLAVALEALTHLPDQSRSGLDATYWVNAARNVQAFAEAYALLREQLPPDKRQAIGQGLATMARRMAEVSVLRMPNNHATRHGAALGSLAVALWNDPAAGGKEKDWLSSAWRTVQIGLSVIGPDGVDLEGAVYGQYADEVLVPFARQMQQVTGHNAMADPVLTARWTAQMRLRQPNGMMPTADDGHERANSVAALLVDPQVPVARLARQEADTIPLIEGLEADALLGYHAEVMPDIGTLDGMASHIYQASGVAVTRSAEGDPQALYGLFLGRPAVAGHARVNPGDFQLAAFGRTLTANPGYAGGGSSDQAQPDYRTARQGNVLLVDGEGPADSTSVTMTQALIAPGLTSSAVRYAVGDATVQRQFAMLHDRYWLVLDSARAGRDHEFAFNLHGAGGGTAIATGTGVDFAVNGTRLHNHFVASGPVSVTTGIARNTLERKELAQPLATATLHSRNATLATVMVPEGGSGNVTVTPLAAQNGTARRISTPEGTDHLLVADDATKEAVGDGVRLTGGAAVVQQRGSRIEGVMAVGTTRLQAGTIALQADTPVDVTLREVGATWQGSFTGPRDQAGKPIPVKLTLQVPAGRSISFKGDKVPVTAGAHGLTVTLSGDGPLTIGPATEPPPPLRGAEPLLPKVTIGGLQFSPETAGFIEWLRLQPDMNVAMATVPPDVLARLQGELFGQLGKLTLDELSKLAAGFLGRSPEESLALASALGAWAQEYGATGNAGFAMEADGPALGGTVRTAVEGAVLVRQSRFVVREGRLAYDGGIGHLGYEHTTQVETDGGKGTAVSELGDIHSDRLDWAGRKASAYAMRTTARAMQTLEAGGSVAVGSARMTMRGGVAEDGRSGMLLTDPFASLSLTGADQGANVGYQRHGATGIQEMTGAAYRGTLGADGAMRLGEGGLFGGNLAVRGRVGNQQVGLQLSQPDGEPGRLIGAYGYGAKDGSRSISGTLGFGLTDPSRVSGSLYSHLTVPKALGPGAADLQLRYDGFQGPGHLFADGRISLMKERTVLGFGFQAGGTADDIGLQAVTAQLGYLGDKNRFLLNSRLGLGDSAGLGLDVGVARGANQLTLGAFQGFINPEDNQQVMVQFRKGPAPNMAPSV
jgi:hypothetical protein